MLSMGFLLRAEIKKTTNERKQMNITIKSNGTKIGSLTIEQFRSACGFSNRQFLAEQIKAFNANKEKAGDPERAEISL